MAKQLGEQPLVHSPTELSNVELAAYTEVGPNCYLENTSMGAYSYCGPYCFFQNAVVGRFSSIAAAVRIGPTRHPTDRPTMHHFTYRRFMYGLDEHDDQAFFAWRAEQVAQIGHDTWIGHGAIIMPNVAVGTGSVIGAGAVVTKDVPPYSIAVGVPATVVRLRFPQEIAERLLAIAWWNWSHEALRERLADFTGSTEAFVEKYDSSAVHGGRP